VTLKNYLETVLWCKVAFYLNDWIIFMSIWHKIVLYCIVFIYIP